VIEYLGRYTHRVAIADSRIKQVSEKQVRFTYRDRKKGNTVHQQSLPGEVFLERFIQHIMPKGFSRIRHYGFLSSRCKAANIQIIRESLGVKSSPVIRKTKKEILAEK